MTKRISSLLLPGRNRLGYALAMGMVVAGGLLLRSRFWTLPSFLSKYGGDALWALLVYLGLGFLFPQLSIRRLAFTSLCLAWSIEFLQLYHVPWLDVGPWRIYLPDLFPGQLRVAAKARQGRGGPAQIAPEECIPGRR